MLHKAENRKDVRMIISVSDAQRTYLEIIHSKEEVNYTYIIRQMISYYIKHNPTPTLLGLNDKKNLKKIIEEKSSQERSIGEIVEDAAGMGDISQICDYAGCSSKDVKAFNLETVNEKNDVELELRLYCPQHFVEASNNGDKLELLD